MNHLKARTRLAILASTLIVFAVVLGELGLFHMNRTVVSLETVYNDQVVPMRDLKRVADLYAANIVDTTHKVRAGTLGRDEGIRQVEAAEAEIAKLWAAYKANEHLAEEMALIAELEPMMAASVAPLGRLKTAIRSSNPYELVRFAEQDLYPLIDYINFKGEGIAASETYPNKKTGVPEGWGLKHVLLHMQGDTADREAVLGSFADAARFVLLRRIANNPPNKRWQAGWMARVETYRRPLK